MHRMLVHIVLVLGCLAAGGLARAQEMIFFDDGSPPNMYAGPQGQARGVYPAIVARAFAKMKVPAQIESRPFRRLIAELSLGHAGTGGIIQTPARMQLADYSQPYFMERLRVYAKGPSPTVAASSPLHAGLRGLTVGVRRGWSYGKAFDQARSRGEFKTIDFSQDRQGFEMLRQGRIDRMVATDLTARVLLKDPRMADIHAADGAILTVGIHLAFSKSMARGALLKAFDQAIEEMRRSGEIDRIVEQEVTRAADEHAVN